MNNREIKFKIWNADQKIMWKEPLTIMEAVGLGIEAGEETYHAGNYEGESENPFIGCEFLQFTGLKDCNGNYIYEGDILKPKNDNTKISVYWRIEYASFGVKIHSNESPFEEDNGLDCELQAWPDGLEIIGNIYENPELLK